MSETENTPTPETAPAAETSAVPAAAQPAGAACLDGTPLTRISIAIACIAGWIALVLVALFYFIGGSSISSNEDFMKFFDDAIEELREDKSPVWSDLKQRRNGVQSALLGVRGGDEETALRVALLADSKPALEFLVMKRGFSPSTQLLEQAVVLGNVDICRFLIDEMGYEPRDKHMQYACQCGHVEICKYLKEEQGIDATNPEFMRSILMADAGSYEMLLGMAAMFTGKVGDVKALMKNHVKVARFLVESGLNIKDEQVRERISRCVNKDVKDYLLDALN